MKKTKHNLLELIDKLIISIEVRNPGKKVTETEKSILYAQWQGQEDKLYDFVKTLGVNEYKAKAVIKRHETHLVEFQVGISLSGEPILSTHLVERLNTFKKSTGKYIKKPKGHFYVTSKAFFSKVFF